MTPFFLTPHASRLPYPKNPKKQESTLAHRPPSNAEEPKIDQFPFRLRLRMVCSLSIDIRKPILIR